MSLHIYRTTGPSVLRVPGRAPKQVCLSYLPSTTAALPRYFCNRPHGHGGRHARIRWDLGGLVRAVWGEIPRARADRMAVLRGLNLASRKDHAA